MSERFPVCMVHLLYKDENMKSEKIYSNIKVKFTQESAENTHNSHTVAGGVYLDSPVQLVSSKGMAECNDAQSSAARDQLVIFALFSTLSTEPVLYLWYMPTASLFSTEYILPCIVQYLTPLFLSYFVYCDFRL